MKKHVSQFEFVIPPPSEYTSRLICKILHRTKGLDLWFLVCFADSDLEDYVMRLYW
jgi:hypothetical protein